MKISVIVPVYNCEKYISKCLDSILSQSYNNIEIVVVDDGSNDRSSEICDEYAKKDSRIIVFHQENRGVSAARNKGLQLATGDLVSFIDSDDTLDSDMYELLVKFMVDNEADISHCGYKHIVREEIRLVHDTKQVYVQTREQALNCLVGRKLFVGGLWNKLFKKELLLDIKFREDLKINEDILFNFEAFRRSEKSVFADYAKYNYIAHFGSSACFVTSNEKKISDACIVDEYIYDQLKETELNDVAIQRYLNSLSNYYRFCTKNSKKQCKNIATTMKSVAKKAKVLGKKNKITVGLIYYCPWLYRIVYSVYDKVRKPNWEV